MSTKLTAVQLLREATTAIVKEMTEKRLSLLDSYSELDAINGTDDYKDSIFDVVSHYNSKPLTGYEKYGVTAGITAATLQLVFPDRVLFNKAKKDLLNEQKLDEKEAGNTFVLRLKT